MQFCESNGINLEFLNVLWEAFQTNTTPDVKHLMDFDTSMILEYLEKTHAYYLDKLIPEIEMNIFRFAQVMGMGHPTIDALINRFDAYKQDLIEHIEEEEKIFFIYAKELVNNGASTVNYKVDQFVVEHEHKEDQLEELLHFLRNNVQECASLPFKMILSKLELLERDLYIHATVEDEVLVAKIRDLELKG
jgi:regulator of cell morphogenesis and NO signaling